MNAVISVLRSSIAMKRDMYTAQDVSRFSLKLKRDMVLNLILSLSNYSLELAARGVPLIEKIHDFLELRKKWDFSGLAFKC